MAEKNEARADWELRTGLGNIGQLPDHFPVTVAKGQWKTPVFMAARRPDRFPLWPEQPRSPLRLWRLHVAQLLVRRHRYRVIALRRRLMPRFLVRCGEQWVSGEDTLRSMVHEALDDPAIRRRGENLGLSEAHLGSSATVSCVLEIVHRLLLGADAYEAIELAAPAGRTSDGGD